MGDLDFYQTHAGRRFYETHVPAIVRALERIADALEAIAADTDDAKRELDSLEREKETS